MICSITGVTSRLVSRLVGRKGAIAGFLGGERGAVAIEFAFLCLPFVLTVLFILQMSLTFFWIQCVEISSIQAARAIRTGAVQEAGLSVEEFKRTKLCPYLSPGMDCDRIVVSVRPISKDWSTGRTTGVYAYIDKTIPRLKPAILDQALAPFCPGGPGDMVFVDVVYKAPAFGGLLAPTGYVATVDGERVLVLRGTSTVMNEPYAATRPVTC